MMVNFICTEKKREFVFLLFSLKFELIRSVQRFEIGVVQVDMNIHYGGVDSTSEVNPHNCTQECVIKHKNSHLNVGLCASIN